MESLATTIMVGVPSDYKVPAKLKGQLVRMPDTAVERLRETDGQPAKPRRKSHG